jgi:hypothetical protein
MFATEPAFAPFDIKGRAYRITSFVFTSLIPYIHHSRGFMLTTETAFAPFDIKDRI